MRRKDFLKSITATGIGASLSLDNLKTISNRFSAPPESCVLIPSETAGPFPLDLTENQYYLRQDIRENQQGVRLNLKLKIIGIQNCLPLQNVRVNIWHCTKEGLYSGYSQANNQGQSGLTYLRGYQYSDANGEVNFITIFPGWYTGRICHIHFQVHVSSSYSAVSQLTFPISAKNALYAANSGLYTKGADPLAFASDNIFSDGYQYQLASLTENTNGEGFDSYLEIGVQGNGTVGLGHIEKETSKIFDLKQNYPNPFKNITTIPFSIFKTSKVSLALWDLSGRKIKNIFDSQIMSEGEYEFNISDHINQLNSQSFIYELTAINEQGTFKSSKMMTCLN